ncbi:MAG: hypothetical protein K0V04_19895 [Deltaproteobacteria bacterium]|nr:hypothetical protein [Deltaproteobacteria bacterium]
MYRDAFDEVVQWGNKVRQRDRLRTQLLNAQVDLTREVSELDALEKAQRKEQRDVDKLEGVSLTRVLLAAVGKAEARLDKERAEATRARLDFEAKRAEVELGTAEVERLRAQLHLFADVDARYAEAFEAKARRMLDGGASAASRLRERIEEVTSAAEVLRELDEAVNAGKWAERHLCDALQNIAKLEDEEAAMTAVLFTTVFTAMATEMPLTHRLEHNLREGQAWIQRFARELDDLSGWQQTAGAIASHGRLLGSFVDLVTHSGSSRARKSQRALEQALQQVKRVMGALAETRPAVARAHQAAFERYRTTVEHG